MTDVTKGLSPAMRRLVILSEPGGWGREDEAIGVEISGAAYRTARKLQDLGLGTYTHGSPYGDLYFNNEDGLALRAVLCAGTQQFERDRS